MQDTIGVDISKGHLDAFALTRQEHMQFANDPRGHRALLRWVERLGRPLIVFEATGAYHRQLESHLAKCAVACCKVNPRQSRRFAEAAGRLAKTDRVDAVTLARMGAALNLSAQSPRSEELQTLKELLTARRALIKDQSAAKARQKSAIQPLIKRQIIARLKQVTAQVKEIDAAIMSLIMANESLAARLDILTSIPGIAETTAFTLLIEMPELGTLSSKQAASLAGLAPISRQSGKWKGNERIRGGRSELRRAIYMPALVAMRFNGELKAKAEALAAHGKPAKVVITAIMRKIIVLANALLGEGRKWRPQPT